MRNFISIDLISVYCLMDTVNKYIVDNIDGLAFSLPFLFSRTFTPFRRDEPWKKRIVEGSIHSIIAFTVDYNVKNKNLDDYTYSYLPVVGSLIYNNIDSPNELIKLSIVGATTSTLKYSIDQNSLLDTLPIIITYYIADINGISNLWSAIFSVFPKIINNYFVINHNHILNYVVSASIITNSISLKYLPIHSEKTVFFAILVGTSLGALISNYEGTIVEQFFIPDHFKASYNTLAKFIDPKDLNIMLERHYITMANIQIGMGFYGNYLLTKMQQKNNLFSLITKGKNSEFNEFVPLSMKYFLTASAYIMVRTTLEGFNTYNDRKLNDFLQDQMLKGHLVKKNNFILASKTNYSIQLYLDDIDSIVSVDNQIIKSLLLGVPKLSRLSFLVPESYAQIGALVVGDYFLNFVFQYMINKNQHFLEQQAICSSRFSKINERDREFAITILQKKALDYTYEEWNKIQQCVHSNNLGKHIFSNMIVSFQVFYNEDILYIGLNVIVAYLSYNGAITIEELYLHSRALESLVNMVLFKSKNQAILSQTNSSINRLEELFNFLNNSKNSFSKVNYKINPEQKFISIKDLEFTRGNENQTKIMIDELELNVGKKYAITGPNGSGKSSFVTLLLYIIENISDYSFNIKSGNIVYPSTSIAMIPQNDYVPFKASLFELILYPQKVNNLDIPAKKQYESSIIKYVNELKVFQTNITHMDLHDQQENWTTLSGGQKKKLFLIRELIMCEDVVIMDETFGPLDPLAKQFVMEKIKDSCLNQSILLVIWHQDQDNLKTTCAQESFFDYEISIQKQEVLLSPIELDCFNYNL